MLQPESVRANNLCCLLSPSIICNGCNQRWCDPCNPSANAEWSTPGKHQCKGSYWQCPSGKKVTRLDVYTDSADGIIYLDVC